MLLEKFPLGPLQCNCSILACERTREAVIVDPGAEAGRILEVLRAQAWKPRYIVHTHAHFDHVGATQGVHAALGGEVCLHRQDQFLYDNVAMQTALFRLPSFGVPPVEHWLEDKESLSFGDYKLEVLHTPGHTPGSLSFYVAGGNGSHVFTGDTLFRGGIGRTDLWGGDFGQLMQSIHKRLMDLSDEAVVHPGHGLETTIGEEREENPFLKG
jgi:hydroxyacylglutathione hydrolase